jgi:hypothetical protein
VTSSIAGGASRGGHQTEGHSGLRPSAERV